MWRSPQQKILATSSELPFLSVENIKEAVFSAPHLHLAVVIQLDEIGLSEKDFFVHKKSSLCFRFDAQITAKKKHVQKVMSSKGIGFCQLQPRVPSLPQSGTYLGDFFLNNL